MPHFISHTKRKMMKWGVPPVRKAIAIFCLAALLSLPGCSGKGGQRTWLESMLLRVGEISSYQLEGVMEVGKETYRIQQWFSAPDKLRTVISQPRGLEQVILSANGKTHAYYSASKQWVSVGDPNAGPLPYGMPLLMALAEMAKENITITETFSTLKITVRGAFDTCEVVVSKRTKLPEECTLVKGKDSVKIRITSLVTGVKFGDELFSRGQ